MAVLHRKGSVIKVKICDAVFGITPLTLTQKNQITAMLAGLKQENQLQAVEVMLQATRTALKYSVKSLEGVQDSDGNKYELQFDEDGTLSDETIEDLSNFEYSDKLTQTLMAQIAKFGSQIEDKDVVVNYVPKESKVKK